MIYPKSRVIGVGINEKIFKNHFNAHYIPLSYRDFTGGAISFLTLLVIGAISLALLFLVFHFIAAPKESGYKKAVKQSKRLHPKREQAVSKKKKSSFKVIDGGKK
ncbi:Uncharacterised protein [Listeria fleischmannii subsp. fleischmannii]|uniref:Uncharacterized protein n=1 Tax=Listeria fleischmannii subsp. fleischmannii TaxID=1671902 RepID=A0A2X3HA85_9LIST|nr:Uncharacterised protein [Listeria fleischmannii subsp. fleischmannii]